MDDAQPIELFHQLSTGCRERTGRRGAAGVARLLPGQTYQAHALIVEPLCILQRADRLRALEQDVGSRRLRIRRVSGSMIRELDELPFHVPLPVLLDLRPRLLVRLLRVRVPPVLLRGRLTEDRREDDLDAAFAQIGKTDGGDLVLGDGLFACRLANVAAAGDVVGKVEMGVDDHRETFNHR
jgi:hypothetical protein